MIREHFVDRVFLSATGRGAPTASLTDADALEAAVKRAMIEHASEAVLLLDASKLATHGKHAVAPLAQMSLVIADELRGGDAPLACAPAGADGPSTHTLGIFPGANDADAT